ncbi:MAG: cytochrome C [Bacteroidales bacterium]|nr:cytochrome C [Bacteroidales bacterium]
MIYPTNLFKVFLTGLFLFQLCFLVEVKSQISPGDLAKVHSHLEGMSNCTKCHILGEKVSNDKCLACHTELKSRISSNKGYHSSAEVKGKQCASCHSDHHGVNFQIIRFDKTKFNHALTGYKLIGAHSKKKCEDCHKPQYIKDAKIKAKKYTFLGMGTDCLSCHTDYHQKSLSSNCTDCHDNEKFKPATKFSHQKSGFKLTGKHQDVPCAECHKTSMRSGVKYQEFKGVKYANCTNCHKDAHDNKFGQKCSECHNTESFAAVGGVKNFDHSKTDFNLEGKHQAVSCKSCHKIKLTTPLLHKHCTDCHVDYHEKQFVKNGVSPDCSECHSVQGFKGSSFTIEKHNSSGFSLKGAHLATPCISCHKKETKWKFKEIGKNCKDCHENIHTGKISEKYYPEENCENCHTNNRWNQVEFDHKTTQFILEGAHETKTCRDCHFNKEVKGHANQAFKDLSMNCSDCHTDTHNQQFDENGKTDCKKCHNSIAFKPTVSFDHNKSQFPLDGKHSGLPCEKCHQPVTIGEATFILYKTKKIKCEDCHQ